MEEIGCRRLKGMEMVGNGAGAKRKEGGVGSRVWSAEDVGVKGEDGSIQKRSLAILAAAQSINPIKTQDKLCQWPSKPRLSTQGS